MKLNTDAIKKQLILILIIVPAVMMLTSCPPQVTPDMVSIVEDEIPPTITIASPSGGDNYYSEVTIRGFITDSVLEEDDDSGRLSSIYYTIANDSFRKGKIDIGLDDSIVKDESFGTGDIEYDLTSHEFEITFSTMVPNKFRDQITVSITTVDSNDNITTETLDLRENDGPYVDFDFYSDATYSEASRITNLNGTEVYLKGSLGNSDYQTDSASEITHLEWGIFGTFWGGSLDLSDDSADWVDYLGIYRALNNDEDYYFDYDPDTRIFNTHQSIELDNGVYFYVKATDSYGHVTEVQQLLSPPALLTLSRPTVDFPFYSPDNSTTLTISSKIIDPNDNLITDSDIGTVSYEFLAIDPADTAAVEAIGTTELYSDSADFGTFFYDNGNFDFNVDTASLSGLVGDISVRVIVTDSENTTIPKKSVLLENDSIDPTISAITFVDDNDDGYVKRGDNIELSFTLADSDSGIKTASLVSDITGETITGTAVETGSTLDPETGVKNVAYYTTSFTVPGAAVSDADGDLLGYSIEITDNVGNTATQSLADQLTFYSPYSNNSFTGTVDYISDNLRDGIYYGRALAPFFDEVTVDFTSSRVLSATPTATVAGQSASVTSLGGLDYQVSYTLENGILNEHDNIPFIISIEDAAGNTDTITEGDTATSIIYDDVAPGTPSTPVYFGANGDSYINDTEADSISMTVGYSSLTVVTGDTIELYLNDSPDVLLGEATSGGGSSSVITVNRNLIDPSGDGSDDGSKSFYAVVTDKAGNVGSSSADLTGITLDTQAPAAAIDGNAYYGDALPFSLVIDTADSDIASYSWGVSGTGSSPNTSGAVITATGTGTDTLSISDCTIDGEYTATLDVTDNAGNAGSQSSHVFIYDENKFVFSDIDGLTANTFYGSDINVHAIISGNECGIQSYTWSVEDNSGANYSFAADPAHPGDDAYKIISSTTDGNATIKCTILDNLNRSNELSIPLVKWETTPPSWVTTPNPTNAGSLNNAAYTFTVEATDANGLHATLPYQWTIDQNDGGNDGTTIDSAILNVTSLDTGGTEDGSYTAVCIAQDVAGNDSDPGFTLNFKWDTTEPQLDGSVSFSSTGNLDSGTTYLNQTDTLTLEFDLTDLTGVNNSAVAVRLWSADSTAYFDNTVTGITPSGSTYSVTHDFSLDTSDDDGTAINYSIYVEDTLASPNTGTIASGTISNYIFYDDYSESCNTSTSVTSTNSGNYVISGNTLTVEYQSDRLLSATGKSASIQDGNGHSKTADTITVSGNTFTAEFDIDGTEGFDEVAIEYNVGFQDIAGNQYTASDVATSIVYDCTAPGTPSAPTWSGSYSNSFFNIADMAGTPYLTVGGLNTAGAVSGDTVEIYLGTSSTGTLLGSATCGASPTSITVNIDKTALRAGGENAKTIIAIVRDAAGNPSAADSGQLSVTLDETKPAISAGGDYTGADSQTATFTHDGSAGPAGPTATDANDTSLIYSWSFDAGSSATAADVLEPEISVSGGDGTYTGILTVTDDAGNESDPDSFDFVWDATQFTIDSLSQSGSGYYNSSTSSFTVTATISGDESGFASLNWSDGSSKLTHVDDVNPTTITFSGPSDGTYTISLVATDNLGRSNDPAAEITFVYDDTAPTHDDIANLGTVSDDTTVTPANVSDGTGSGVDSYRWEVTGPFSGTFTNSTFSFGPTGEFYLNDVTGSGYDGSYSVDFYITDTAGNESSADNFTFTWLGNKAVAASPSIELLTGGSGSSGGNMYSGSGTSSSASGRIRTSSFSSGLPTAVTTTQQLGTASYGYSRSPGVSYRGNLYTAGTAANPATAGASTPVETQKDADSAVPEATLELISPSVPAASGEAKVSALTSAAAGASSSITKKISTAAEDTGGSGNTTPGRLWLMLLIVPAGGAVLIFRKRRP